MMKTDPVPDSVVLRPYLREDTRSERQVEKMRFDLRRRFAGYKTSRERWLLPKTQWLTWEYVYDPALNPDAPDPVSWKRCIPKYKEHLKIDRTKFSN